MIAGSLLSRFISSKLAKVGSLAGCRHTQLRARLPQSKAERVCISYIRLLSKFHSLFKNDLFSYVAGSLPRIIDMDNVLVRKSTAFEKSSNFSKQSELRKKSI